MTTTRETGTVIAVTTTLASDEMAADAATGATTIYVEDAADFDEAGGLLQVTHDVPTELDPVNAPGVMTNVLTAVSYPYNGIDDGTGAVFLDSPLVAPALAGDIVKVINPLTNSPWQEVVASVALAGFDNDDALEAVVDHALVPFLPEGIREEGTGEVVTLEWKDDELRVVNILSQAANINSDAGGWDLADDGASFENVSVAGNLGADTITANAMSLGGLDLQTGVIDAMPRLMVYVKAPVGTNSAQTAAEQVVFRVNAGAVSANRLLRFAYAGRFAPVPQVAGDVYTVQIRYTTDGSTPTTSSPAMDHSAAKVYVGSGGQGTPFAANWLWSPPADYDTLRLAVTTVRDAGTGFPVVLGTDAAHAFRMSVEDMGPAESVGGTISQISKATGTSDSEPTATYTKSWTATWARTFGDDGTLANDDALYQGYPAGYKSQMGFNDADIRSKLSGATIKKVTLTYRVKSAATSLPTVVVRTHSNSNPPASWSGSNGSIVSKAESPVGATKTVDLPLSVGTAFKSGTTRGIIFGPAPTSSDVYDAIMYATGTDSAPKLTITYEK